MANDPSADPQPILSARRRETLAFGLVLAVLLGGFFHESLLGGKILSPADVLLVEASFHGARGVDYEPANRLLMDPVLQFQPWLELNRSQIRQGCLPLWNPLAGCGAPHLANGQSAVFDPFNLIAYLWTVPDALAWMAAGRLWVAGLGMFLLAGRWRLGRWGRWFAGLAFPFSGFLVAWLLYPVTPVAIWTPWLFLVSDQCLRRPSGVSIALIAIVTALILFGGHVQTGAHVLLAVGLFVVWSLLRSLALTEKVGQAPDRQGPTEPGASPVFPWGVLAWSSGIVLGLALAAVEILPLADYLTKSPVWTDRRREVVPWWKPSTPRLLDTLCTALPYVYGSQQRGQPNLARAVGVHNLNESSGGFAGLPTLLLLVPLAWSGLRRRRDPGAKIRPDPREVAPFLFGLAVFGFLGAFRLPPVDNLLRLLPVLNVTDNRRLSLWLAFSFPLLGGIGLDRLRGGVRLGKRWSWTIALAAVGLFIAGGAIIASEPALRRRAEAHYREAAERKPTAAPEIYLRRADRQVGATVEFLPRYYAETGCGLLILAGLMAVARRRPGPNRWLPASIFVLTLADLGRFGVGLNPAIDREIQYFEPPVIAYLRRELRPGERALGIGEELPPNVLMRFGLGDPRNYDSVELARNLEWLAPLFEKSGSTTEAATSRRAIDWRGVARAKDRLEEAGVAMVVGASPPPDGLFEKAEKIGEIWVVRLDAMPWAGWISDGSSADFRRDRGRIEIHARPDQADTLIVREMWDEGWTARIDGAAGSVHLYRNTFLEIVIPKGSHELILEYDPPAVRRGLTVSSLAAVLVLGILGLTRIRRY